MCWYAQRLYLLLANMHQGWTKYAQHLWYKTQDNGLATLVYGPNKLNTTVGKNNTAVSINEVTAYPFNDEIGFEIATKNTAQFEWKLRIPSWCADAIITVNGKEIQHAKGGNWSA